MAESKPRVLVVVGTRPEFIKMAPVVRALRAGDWCDAMLCATGQHLELTSQLLDVFGLTPDARLDIMVPGQSLNMLAARLLQQMDELLVRHPAQLLLVQGDTTTTMIGALAAFYRNVPVAHVEAGLRTHNLRAPWPEEANRQIASRITTLHFPPTQLSRKNLLAEGIAEEGIFVTGNTVVDSLLHVRDYLASHPVPVPGLPDNWRTEWKGRPIVLITGHRRESFGGGLEAVFAAIVELATKFPDALFVYPVHLNPSVRQAVDSALRGAARTLTNIVLIEPLGYLPFVQLMDASTILLTDSGGLQEEGPSLGKPVLVTRDVTERPEVVDAGAAKLVGTDTRLIVKSVSELLSSEANRAKMRVAVNPVGDGRASERIAALCRGYLESGSFAGAKAALTF